MNRKQEKEYLQKVEKYIKKQGYLSYEELKTQLDNIKGTKTEQKRLLLILGYFCSTILKDILAIKSQDIYKPDKGTVAIKLQSGKERWFPAHDELFKEVWNYSRRIPDNMYVLHYYAKGYSTDKVRYFLRQIFQKKIGCRFIQFKTLMHYIYSKRDTAFYLFHLKKMPLFQPLIPFINKIEQQKEQDIAAYFQEQ